MLILAVATIGLDGCASRRTRGWVQDGFRSGCGGAAGWSGAAQANGADLDTLAWSPFGAPEQGWRTYAPAVAQEIGTRCAPDSPAFADRLARWAERRGLAADGRMTPALFEAMKSGWQARRPFLALRARDVCPDPPDPASLAALDPGEGYGGKAVLLTPPALAAYRALRAAARRDLGLPDGDATLAVFSGYRSPQYDAERCERERNCQGVVRAQCSAHRTGAALDLALGAAPGYAIDASAGPNRLFQTRTPAYRWLLANAGRFGFVNYVFEPWHWEWTGAGRRR